MQDHREWEIISFVCIPAFGRWPLLAILRTLCYTLLVVNARLTLNTMHLTDHLSVRL